VVDLRFQSPCSIQLAGVSNSGKTFLTAQIIENRDRLFTQTFDKIVFLYREWQPLYDKLEKEQGVLFTSSLDEVEEHSRSPEPVLIILDDVVMDLISNSKEILPYFLSRSHHGNNTVMILTQAIFLPNARLMQINCQYLILFKLARDSSSVLRLGCQIHPLSPRFLYNVYLDVVEKKPFAHLVIDSTSTQSPLARFRSSVFYWEPDFLLYSPK